MEQWLRGSSVQEALKMQKPDDAIVVWPAEKKAEWRRTIYFRLRQNQPFFFVFNRFASPTVKPRSVLTGDPTD